MGRLYKSPCRIPHNSVDTPFSSGAGLPALSVWAAHGDFLPKNILWKGRKESDFMVEKSD